MKYYADMMVSAHDTDYTDAARPSAILRYMQEAADWHLRDAGLSGDHLREKGYAFFLSRVAVKYYRAAKKYEKLRVSTWACPSTLAAYNRCGEICDARGGLIAQLMSVWALVGVADRRIYKPSEVPLEIEIDELLKLPVPLRVNYPRELELKAVGERTIVYADVDINRHMNNTYYPDMLYGYIPACHLEGKRISSCTISYRTEAALGDTVTVLAATPDNGKNYYFKTQKADGITALEAQIKLTGMEKIEEPEPEL